MAWIRDHVDPDAPDAIHIVLGIDCSEQASQGERAVLDLLGRGMEGDEGVFYLLPHDLCCDVARSGESVTVDLLTTGTGADWVKLLTAPIPHPEHAEIPAMPIVLIEHEGVVGLDELLASIPESGLHIIGPKPEA